MREIAMDRLIMGNDYYDENGIKFKFVGARRRPIQINYGGFVQYVQGGNMEYVFQYETGLSINENLNPFRVFKEDIKEFKFGV